MNPKRILIVDDEPGITRSIKLTLEAAAGYAVRTENDSTRAVDAARDFRPQLILLDVLMPYLDGCDVSALIHADPELKDTPIIFLTALANNEDTGGHAGHATGLSSCSCGIPAENQDDRPSSGQWLSTKVVSPFPNLAVSDAPNTSQPSRIRLIALALAKLATSW